MARSKSGWILVLSALLPVAACDVDRTEDDALPEAEDSRLPGYEVTLPDVDVHLDSTTISVPDIDIEPGSIERMDDADVDGDGENR